MEVTHEAAIEGGCLCGAVRLRSEARPLAVWTCWCRLCQYLGAGSATVNVLCGWLPRCKWRFDVGGWSGAVLCPAC